jgi:phosphonatase-like hydrolase
MRFTRRDSLKLISATAAGANLSESAGATPSRVRLIVLDVGGTIIQDRGDVPEVLQSSFAKHGIRVELDEIAKWRGASKREVVQHFVNKGFAEDVPRRDALSKLVYEDFTARAIEVYKTVPAIAGAETAFQTLRRNEFLLAATTGFGREIALSIFRRLGWERYFAAIITSDDVAQGRPSPFMIFHAMETARVSSVAEVVTVGDTPLDLQAGTNGGARGVVGVLSGASKRAQLDSEPHTNILGSVVELPDLLESKYQRPPVNH